MTTTTTDITTRIVHDWAIGQSTLTPIKLTERWAWVDGQYKKVSGKEVK